MEYNSIVNNKDNKDLKLKLEVEETSSANINSKITFLNKEEINDQLLKYYNEEKIIEVQEKHPSISIEDIFDSLEKTILDIEKNFHIKYKEEESISKFKTKITKSIQDKYAKVESEKWVEWCKKTFNRSWRVTKPIITAVGARLRDNYKVEDFIKATEIAMTNYPHNENDFKYLAPKFMVNPNKLEKWLNTPMGKPPKSFSESIISSNEKVIMVFEKLEATFGLTSRNLPSNQKYIVEFIEEQLKTNKSRGFDSDRRQILEAGEVWIPKKIDSFVSKSTKETTLFNNQIGTKWLEEILGIAADKRSKKNSLMN